MHLSATKEEEPTSDQLGWQWWGGGGDTGESQIRYEDKWMFLEVEAKTKLESGPRVKSCDQEKEGTKEK